LKTVLLIILSLFSLISYGDSNITFDSSNYATYTNPLKVFVADPCVLKVGSKYYLYGTSVANIGFKVWESNNLVNWEEKGFSFSKFEEGNEWGQGDFWAPEVIKYKNKYYMIYSARASDGHLKIALAESLSPIGPFLNTKAPLFDDGFSNIDGHIFVDSDGTPYLFYVRDCSENIINGNHISQIYVQKMSEDLLTLEGKPILVVEPSQDWEGLKEDWQWNEGPFVIKENGTYYLLYSANYFASPEYSIGYATADNPMGPWIKSKDNPILSKDLSIGVSGPGHCSVTNSPDSSELFIVYHSHAFPKSPSGIRVLNIDRIYFDENGELKVKGPTRTPQPFPH
jgi:beta-xylosidase